jgi:hypothetical protein
LTPDVGARIDAALTGWRSGSSAQWRQVAANIEAETALSVVDFALLLVAFASELAAGVKTPEACWTDACRSGHKFKGIRFPDPLPAVVGRAAPIGNFAKLMSSSGVGLTDDDCETLLRDVAMAGAAVTPRQASVLRRASLGRYLVWATFCPANPADRPFDHLRRTTDAIRTAFGLGHLRATDTLVLVSYRTQGARVRFELFRPTVGDAEESHWYRPHANSAAHHGMTCPLTPNVANLPGQPEVVHSEITGETIFFPIYLTV